MFENSSTRRLLEGLSEALRDAAPTVQDAFARRQILGAAHVLAAMAPRVRWADVGHAETFEQDVRRKAAALGWRDAERPGVADALEFLWKRTDIEPEALDAVGGLIEASKKELASDLDRRHGS